MAYSQTITKRLPLSMPLLHIRENLAKSDNRKQKSNKAMLQRELDVVAAWAARQDRVKLDLDVNEVMAAEGDVEQ